MSEAYPQDWVIYYREGKQYKLFPGELCLVDPASKSREAESVRNKYCRVTAILSNGKVRVRYLESNRCGKRWTWDLIPQRRVIDINSKAKSNQSNMSKDQ